MQQLPRHSPMAPNPPPPYRQPSAGFHPPNQTASFLQPPGLVQPHSACGPWRQQPAHTQMQTGPPVRHAYSASHARALSAAHVQPDQGLYKRADAVFRGQRQVDSSQAQGYRQQQAIGHVYSSQQYAEPQLQSMRAPDAANGQAVHQGTSSLSAHAQATVQHSVGPQHQPSHMSLSGSRLLAQQAGHRLA